ncbi:MAG: hypothetical protein IPM53_06950 [Anaerolineaceae bacterium]|nr:hypothetical protein [Anaerolineaceae bacterium]
MPQKKTFFLWLLLLTFVTGCDLWGSDVADSAEASSDETAAAEELKYTGEPPADDKGNVFGEIRWNGTGADKLEVALCSDFSSFSGCKNSPLTTTTDANGRYLFKDIDPGVYALSVKVFETDDWLYISNGIFSSMEFDVKAGKTLTVGIQDIFKLDLILLEPIDGGTVPGDSTHLRWNPYRNPQADYYKVSLYPDEGDAIVFDERVEESTLAVELLPVSCGYRWYVEAFNGDGVKITESAEPFTFVVDSLPGSCQLAIQEPADGAEVRGDNILLNWEDSPLAESYKILMWNDDDPNRTNVLDFFEVNESSYQIPGVLVPARYVWSVSAYDKDGNKIGATEIYDFVVRP